MKILLTGGAGFIGSHIAIAYAKLGHDVIVVDKLPEPKGRFTGIPSITYCQENLGSWSKGWLSCLSPDIINHHAAFSESGALSVGAVIPDNVYLTAMLSEYCAENDCRIIFASSGAVYGNCAMNYAGYESPISLYGASKSAAEKFVMLAPDHVTFRYSNVYGYPWGRGNTIIPKILNAITDGSELTLYGKCVRDFVYIDDIVKANVISIEYPKGGVYNVSTGVSTSINDLYSTICGIIGEDEYDMSNITVLDSYSPHSYDPAINYFPGHILGKHVVKLQEGLEKTIQEYLGDTVHVTE